MSASTSSMASCAADSPSVSPISGGPTLFARLAAHSETKEGFFGEYGGQFVPEALKTALKELADAYHQYKNDPEFLAELDGLYRHFGGRPTPVFFCENLSRELGGAEIYLKREDLNHLGAHKLNNTLGQMLLAKRMGKTRVVAETGAGQHGVATAATAALMGLKCVVYMGEEDTKRQKLNVLRMQMMGATVVPVMSGQRTLKEAVDEALAAYVADPEAFYVLGSAVGPYPYPDMVRDFQSVIGREARRQFLEMTGSLPDSVVACVGGGSNAIGIFSGFVADSGVQLVGVEPGGRGDAIGDHAATLCHGTPGVLHGFRSYLLQDADGQPAQVYSISAGLDYPGVGPEHGYLKDTGRASYVSVTDTEALNAFFALCRHQGIVPALESSHALAYALRVPPSLPGKRILVNLSGRGDKDVEQIAALLDSGAAVMPE